MKVMHDLGVSPTAIARRLDRSHNTVIKYLDSDVFNDPSISQIVERIKEKELSDLYLLGAKARKNLHTMLDQGKGGMIPTVALMDRSFQQRRLLEGQSTENIANLTAIIQAAHDLKRKKDREIEESERKRVGD